MFGKIKKFYLEVTVELKKVTWSTKKEVLDSTWIVILSSLCLGVFIGMTDFIVSRLIGLVIR